MLTLKTRGGGGGGLGFGGGGGLGLGGGGGIGGGDSVAHGSIDLRRGNEVGDA